MLDGFTPLHRGGAGPPMVCMHGFTGTWRVWELVLPALERHHDVLAPTLPGHVGGPPLPPGGEEDAIIDAIERAMDDAGFETAHLVGNSLGGYLALKLAERGRARTVVALAPAGGWARGDNSFRDTLAFFTEVKAQLKAALPNIDRIVSTDDGRRRATAMLAENYEHIPTELVAHIAIGTALCDSVDALVAYAMQHGWNVDGSRVQCPVRVVWGTEDKLLLWPSAAVRVRQEWAPAADWVELEGVGHCPQLDVPAVTADLILGFAG